MTTAIPARMEALASALGSKVQRGVRLAPFTTFRIGGPADLFYEATSADELAMAIQAARAYDVPWFVLGLGANILVGDRGFRGLVIRNSARAFTIGESGTVRAESGAVVETLILETVRQGWSGLEHYIGIPSTVGGAVWQNLHFLSPAPERERTMFIAEVFESCEILTEEGERKTVGADYVKFGYDDTVFHHRRDIVLATTFRLTRGDRDGLHRILQENLSWRGSRHPWLQIHPSAGSIFKKIEGVGAGRLVDQCGLKGHRIGDAQISHIHANIMVNLGHATAADVRALIAHAQQAVQDRFQQRLEPEIGFIGDFQTCATGDYRATEASDSRPVRTSGASMDHFLRAAIDEARAGLSEGGIPIGSVLVIDDRIVGRGHNRRVQRSSPVLHAEMDCLENAGRLRGEDYRRATIYSTLSPCDMCSGAILLYEIPRVVIGENRTFRGPEDYMRSRGVEIDVVDDDECVTLMREFIAARPELWAEDTGE